MQKVLPLIAVAFALNGSATFAAASSADLSATLAADAYDCTTVSVNADGADLDPDAFTATSTASGGCTLVFKDKAPKVYTATVKDANGVLQTFKSANGKLVHVTKPASGTDAKLVSP